ncbi:helix-turn-helix domain-containing protein [Streptomyces sp. PSKA54]|uniref:Helix-turn-helix domain-containing protein n=1 Tax=Streptomyces himalayensis subsp. aureolus TaxID=2758039 RepID=A0A7W2HKG8_9ACTN|nr:helix-turn-helix domain-containing protein [Streptomyces himalayensis]MBA4867151.1 helix-turn-helix domain-containing protein [Streptomyces himalayensis subsp. aureolus]
MDAEGLGAVARRLLEAVSESDLAAADQAITELTMLLRPTTSDEVLAGLRNAALSAHEVTSYHRRRVGELTALHKIAVDLASVRDPDEILQAIVRAAQAVIPSADATYLLLSEPGTGWNYIKASVGLHSPDFMHVRVRDGYGMVSRIYETRAPLWTRNYVESAGFSHDSVVDRTLAEDGLRSVLGIPMIVRGVPQGVLYAANRVERSFTADEVSVLQQFADLASIAIENAEYFAGLQRAARDIGEDMSAVERAAQLHADLTKLITEGAQITDVLAPINGVLPGRLFLLDASDLVLASNSDSTLSDEVVPQIRQSQRARSAVSQATPSGFRHVVAVTTRNAYHGALVIESEEPLSDLDRRTLDRIGHVIALLTLQQQALIEAEDQVRGDFLHELLETRHELSDASQLRAHSRGVDLKRRVVAVAISVPSSRQLAARRVVSDFARSHNGVGGEHNGIVAAVLPSDAPEEIGALVHARLTRELHIPAIVCASRPVDGTTGTVCDAFIEARRCAALLRGLGSEPKAVTTHELALFSLLFTPGREHELASFLDHALGRLLAYDNDHNARLVDTIAAYFENNLNVAKTARALYVHANTVVKRLERVADLLGAEWQSEPSATRLRVALLLRSYGDGSPIWEGE